MSEIAPAPVPPASRPFGRALVLSRAAARAAIGLLYPPSCIACGAATGAAHALCAGCWAGIRFIERPYCERLGTPFAADYGPGLLSPAAVADPPVYRRARAVAQYDDTARALVHRLKYGDRLDLAPALGRMMARAGAELLAEADVIVPVPLHRARLWGRRFNQAMALARTVSGLSGVALDPFLLARVKRTQSQVGLTRAQRAANLQGAFRVPAEAKARLRGRRVLLVDDVLTTGATANAASRALLRGGAEAVDVLAFARVVTEALEA
ncbi:MAG TPA: ComF family protein [Microvirga sp.]|jgi:ComF family protein|nr:ComF family protein [Microvirga sp.]